MEHYLKLTFYFYVLWAFPEKDCNPPVEDINRKFQGSKLKIEEKTWSSRGSMQKNGKFQVGHGKFDWKSRDVKKFDILNRGGTIIFWKSPFLLGIKKPSTLNHLLQKKNISAASIFFNNSQILFQRGISLSYPSLPPSHQYGVFTFRFWMVKNIKDILKINCSGINRTAGRDWGTIQKRFVKNIIFRKSAKYNWLLWKWKRF